MEDGRSFTVWPSYWEALHELNDGRRLKLYDAMFAFGTLGEEPFFDDVVCKAVFAVIRPNIEKSVKAHETGSIGGKSKAPSKVPSKAPSTIPDEGLSTEREREREGERDGDREGRGKEPSRKNGTGSRIGRPVIVDKDLSKYPDL